MLIKNLISKIFPLREIHTEGGELYLRRWTIYGWKVGSTKNYRFNIYLHHIVAPDADPYLHSHPWKWSFSFILWGHYVEQLKDTFRYLWIMDTNTINDKFHRISKVSKGGCWTILITGPKIKTWYFQDPEGNNIEWRDRLKERGLKADY